MVVPRSSSSSSLYRHRSRPLLRTQRSPLVSRWMDDCQASSQAWIRRRFRFICERSCQVATSLVFAFDRRDGFRLPHLCCWTRVGRLAWRLLLRWCCQIVVRSSRSSFCFWFLPLLSALTPSFLQSTFCVNSLAHWLGETPFDDKHSPRVSSLVFLFVTLNLWLISILSQDHCEAPQPIFPRLVICH